MVTQAEWNAMPVMVPVPLIDHFFPSMTNAQVRVALAMLRHYDQRRTIPALSIDEIARRANISPAAAQKAIVALEKEEWVRREYLDSGVKYRWWYHNGPEEEPVLYNGPSEAAHLFRDEKAWHSIKHRYGAKCLCCGRPEAEVALHRDHVIPTSLGGTNTADNIQPLCQSCNSRKGARHIDYRPDMAGTNREASLWQHQH